MSSILKALKRLEEEKAQRRDTPVDIACDILRASRRRRRSFGSGWTPAALGAITVAVLAGSLLLAWTSFGRPRAVAPVEPAHTAQVSPQHSPPMNTAATAPRAMADEPEIVEVRMAEPPPSARVEEPSRRTDLPPKVSPSGSAATPSPEPFPADPLPAMPATAPHLAISGIAFQPERQDRLAIVNDLPVMEGTVIDGATVEEILPDRVRFSLSGKIFEVTLGKVD